MTTQQPCARWGCKETATYEYPLCLSHWRGWDAHELEECTRCYWFFDDGGGFSQYDFDDYSSDLPFLCNDCLYDILTAKRHPSGRESHTIKNLETSAQWDCGAPGKRRVLAHVPLERTLHYIYVLKLSDSTFYVGQTNNLEIRLRDHGDREQWQTRGKDPKLVYFETIEGEYKEVNRRENELITFNEPPHGHRHLRELIERFRAPLKLLDLEA